MKQQFLLLAFLCAAVSGWAQTDTTHPAPSSDTIRIGQMVIVKSGNGSDISKSEVYISHRHNNYYRPSNISTNWLIFDFGFSNYNDNTNYSSSAAQAFAPGSNSDWFHLRTGKSINVNIWFFMQRLNLIDHVVNLKYGLGLELNNYRYTNNIKYLSNPTKVVMDTINYYKNKLAADYITVPLMLNFNFTPHKRNPFGISAGISAGYLYSSRQKFKSSEAGKTKTHDDFDLRPWKISYIAEVQLGPVRLYGSYATQSMFREGGLDQTPYNVGLRFSNW